MRSRGQSGNHLSVLFARSAAWVGMHMKGMRPRRQTFEIRGKDQGSLLACADGYSRVARMYEAYLSADAICARQVEWNDDVLRRLAIVRAGDWLVLRRWCIPRGARQPDGCTGPQQARVLGEPILIGPKDDLPFRRVVVDLIRDALQRVVLLQNVLHGTRPGIIRLRKAQRERDAACKREQGASVHAGSLPCASWRCRHQTRAPGRWEWVDAPTRRGLCARQGRPTSRDRGLASKSTATTPPRAASRSRGVCIYTSHP